MFSQIVASQIGPTTPLIGLQPSKGSACSSWFFLTNQEQSGYHAQSDFGGTCVVNLDNTVEFAIK